MLAADLDAVHAELAGRHVDEPLQHPVRALGAEAAVRALLVLVREDRGERVLDVLDPVRPDDLRERVAVRARAELEVRAVVVDAADAQRAERAVVVEGELGVVPAIGAGVVVVRDVRDAVLDVLHRAARRASTRKPANVGTLCMKNFEPKLPPAAIGTTLSLLVGIFSDPAISQWKYVKFIELA